jgi:hypothetical protein
LLSTSENGRLALEPSVHDGSGQSDVFRRIGTHCSTLARCDRADRDRDREWPSVTSGGIESLK